MRCLSAVRKRQSIHRASGKDKPRTLVNLQGCGTPTGSGQAPVRLSALRVCHPKVIWLREIFCGSGVLGTDMRCELLVALLFVEPLHIVNGFTNEWP